MARTRWPPGPVNPGLLHRLGRSGRHRRWVPEPGARPTIVSQDSPDGVSRLGGQAGTQAPDPTPVSRQNRGSRAGSTIHSLPAEYLQALAEPVPAPQARRSSRSEPVPRLQGFTTRSSRIPSDLARRTRPVWQYQAVPALSALLPALPGVSRIGLRSAPARLLRQLRPWQGFGLSADAVVVLTEPQSCGCVLDPYRSPGHGM